MMREFEKWRELAFCPLIFVATGSMGPSMTAVF